jgi:glycosyltransferase involved in cell wall biosynthesis
LIAVRILILSEHQALVGGLETYLQAVAGLLKSAGHEVGFAFRMLASADAASVSDHCSGPVWQIGASERTLDEPSAWRPNVAYCHGFADPQIESAIAARFPTVAFAHGYYGTCISLTKTQSFPRIRPCQRQLGPACLGLYLPCRCGGLNPLVGAALYRRERLRQRVLPRYRAVLVASEHMRDEYARHGVPRGRLHRVRLFPPGTVPDVEPPARRPRTDRVLFVGRLTATKGWRELIEAIPIAAAALSRSLTLVVAGDGPDAAVFQSAARRRCIPAEFLGWVGPERRETEMRRADILVVPSVWPEPFGLVGIEAGCVGLPAVAYAVGGIPEWLTPGVSGESASGARPDPKELAAALIRTLADDDHRHRLAIGAWQMAHEFTAQAHRDLLVSILEAAASRTGAVLCSTG